MDGRDRVDAAVTTKKTALGQVLLCRGCCCGRDDRGYPPVPVDRIKAAWKAAKLNKTVQLTISGCLGPCDVANVAAIASADGMTWLGGITTDSAYDALLGWAERCHSEGTLLPLPESLREYRFECFGTSPSAGRGIHEGGLGAEAGASAS